MSKKTQSSGSNPSASGDSNTKSDASLSGDDNDRCGFGGSDAHKISASEADDGADAGMNDLNGHARSCHAGTCHEVVAGTQIVFPVRSTLPQAKANKCQCNAIELMPGRLTLGRAGGRTTHSPHLSALCQYT